MLNFGGIISLHMMHYMNQFIYEKLEIEKQIHQHLCYSLNLVILK